MFYICTMHNSYENEHDAFLVESNLNAREVAHSLYDALNSSDELIKELGVNSKYNYILNEDYCFKSDPDYYIYIGGNDCDDCDNYYRCHCSDNSAYEEGLCHNPCVLYLEVKAAKEKLKI